jgi:hypothetical protein
MPPESYGEPLLRSLAAAFAVLWAAAASAEPRASREAETGVLDVPLADSAELGSAMLGGELRLDLWGRKLGSVGPSPLSLVTGLSHGLEVGVFAHEGDLPGEPQKSPFLFGAALKFHVLDAGKWWPALAVDLAGDRLNWKPSLAARVILTSRPLGPVRITAMVGPQVRFEKPFAVGPVGGLAVLTQIRPEFDVAVEGLADQQGFLVGTGVTWELAQHFSLNAGVNWRPNESGVRINIGVGFASPAPKRPEIVEQLPKPVEEAPAPIAPGAPRFPDDTAHLKLRIKTPPQPPDDIGRHLQYGPGLPPQEPPSLEPQAGPPVELKSAPALKEPAPKETAPPAPSTPPKPEPLLPQTEEITPAPAASSMAEPTPAPEPGHLQETQLASIDSLVPHMIPSTDPAPPVSVTASPIPATGGSTAGAIEQPPAASTSCCLDAATAPTEPAPPEPTPYEVPPNAPADGSALKYEVSGPSNPALPDAVLFWDGQSSVEVLDGLSLSLPPGTSGLGRPQAEALNVFVNRAARDGAGLIVWGRAPKASDLPDAAVRARDIARIAANMARLPPSRVLARATEWAEANAVDVVVLKTASTNKLPPAQDEKMKTVLTSLEGRRADLQSQATRLDGLEDALANRKTSLQARTAALDDREKQLASQEAAIVARTGGTSRKKTARVVPVGEAESGLLAEELAHQKEEQAATKALPAIDARLAKKTKQETILHGRLDWLRIKAEQKKEEAARAKAETEVLDTLAQVLSERSARIAIATERAAQEERRATEREARLSAWDNRLAAVGAPPEALETGEAGRRQLSAAVRKHERDIQRCLDSELKLTQTTAANHVLKITVDRRGRVARSAIQGGELQGTPVEKCVQDATGTWRFPASDEDYELEIPVRTTAKGGAP